MTCCFSAYVLKILLDAVASSMEVYKLRLQRAKCKVHVLALSERFVEEWPTELHELDSVKLAPKGLIILGTEACGDDSLPLGPCAEVLNQRASGRSGLAHWQRPHFSWLRPRLQLEVGKLPGR